MEVSENKKTINLNTEEEKESFIKGFLQNCDSMGQVADNIKQDMNIKYYDEIDSNILDNAVELREEGGDFDGCTIHTSALSNLYDKYFSKNDSSLVAIKDNGRYLLIQLLVKSNGIYYNLPIRYVSFHINFKKAIDELFGFIMKLGK